MPVLWHDLLISALPWRVTLSSSCTWLIFRHSKCSSYACTAFGRSLSIPPFQRSPLCKPWNPTARTGPKTCKEQSCSKLPWLSSMLLFGAAWAMLCIVGIDKDLWSMISPDGCIYIYIPVCVCVCFGASTPFKLQMWSGDQVEKLWEESPVLMHPNREVYVFWAGCHTPGCPRFALLYNHVLN